MEWWDFADDDDVEGGILEFDSRLELHVYRRLDSNEPVAVWLNDDASYYRRVELGQA
jgi:hypothetical protein